MSASAISPDATRPDPEKNQLNDLISHVGSLAEDMRTTTIQSVGWYLKSVELQQACLKMRSLQVNLADRSQRLSGLSVTRRIRLPHAQSSGARLGLGRGGNGPERS
jgi:hypothetical protein